jgi:iron complex outermembrane recepter protein
MLKSMTFRSTLAAVACALSLSAHAMADSPKKVEIAAGDLRPALLQLSRAYGVELLYQPSQLDHLRTAGVRGDYTPEAAVKLLLKGTPLELRTDPSGAMMVVDPKAPHAAAVSTLSEQASPAPGSADGSQPARSLQLAQANPGAAAVAATPVVVTRDTNGRPEALQEVIVTAQKREERLLDVPISIVALSGEELQKRNVTTLEDLPSVVPGLAISSNGPGRYIELRGISNLYGTSTVGVYLDEADVTLGAQTEGVQINPAIYDLERVEVLRGPQGTLYGEGSAGGTIRLITKDPNLTRPEFAADVAALFTEEGSPSQRINAVLNMPLINNQLGLRVAGSFDHEGGWIDQPAADQRDINHQDLTNVRAKLLWEPAAQFTLSTMMVINRNNRSNDVSDQNTPNQYTQAFNLTTSPRLENNYELYNLTMAYTFSGARLLNTLTRLDASSPGFDGSQYTYYSQPAPGVQPLYYYGPAEYVDDRVWTDELRLTSIGSGPWQWTVGGFFRNYFDELNAPITYYGVPGPPGTPLSSYPSYPYVTDARYKSWSGFGDFSYNFRDSLTLGAGVRYFHDRQTFDDRVFATQQSADFHSTNPRFYMQYKLAHDANVYLSAANGFRSGGYNGYQIPSYGPESVWTYELGTKMNVIDGRLSFNAAVFLSHYEDYQSLAVPPGLQFGIVTNTGTARTKGVEWDLSYRPAPRWILSCSGDYLNSVFTEIDPTALAYKVGDPVDLVPKYQFTVSGERDFSWKTEPAFVRVDYSQQGRETFRNRSIGPWYDYTSDVIQLLNVHAGVQWDRNLRLGIFAQNLLNDQGFTNPFGGIGAGVRSRPRTYGLEFGMSFE